MELLFKKLFAKLTERKFLFRLMAMRRLDDHAHSLQRCPRFGKFAGRGMPPMPPGRTCQDWSGRWESKPRHAAREDTVLPLNYARVGVMLAAGFARV